jgi:hypothetical protein
MCEEFDRQIETLVRKGYPALAGITEREFVARLEPLRARAAACATEHDANQDGRIPFVVVIKNDLVPPEAAMPLVEVKGARGVVNMYPAEPASFTPVAEVCIPDGAAYLLTDVDTGVNTRNIAPADARPIIAGENRLPLTIDEGVALVTHFPDVLTDKRRYTCFSMLASRRGDRRVPALWISYGAPRLGWCWDGNPHSWLGSASCKDRIGV